MKAFCVWTLMLLFVAGIFASGSMRSARGGTSGGILPPVTTGSSGSGSTTGASTGSSTGSNYELWPQLYITGTQEASGTTSYLNETSHVFRMQMLINNVPSSFTGQLIQGSNPAHL